jgi:type II secretory pathway predicted ATPase ExeA
LGIRSLRQPEDQVAGARPLSLSVPEISGSPAVRPRPQARPRRASSLDIYTSHFGLSARPFTLVPDPGFLFWSKSHQHAYAMLEYGVLTRAPITLITGEIGTGKTTLIHQLMNTIGSGVRIGLLSNTHGGPEELLRWILFALGQPTPKDGTHPGLVTAFQEYLVAEYAAGNRVVLIFDEAQNLQADALESLRMLTNVNSGKDDLLQLVLIGQPELRALVHRPGLNQFAQRVASSYPLGALDAETVRAYIAHRLRVAGVKSNPFTQAATDLIHEATGGIPRRINQLCDLAMVYAFTAGQRTVIRFTVQQVLDDGTFFGALPVGRTAPEVSLQ